MRAAVDLIEAPVPPIVSHAPWVPSSIVPRNFDTRISGLAKNGVSP
jgi:hypothetical protein